MRPTAAELLNHPFLAEASTMETPGMAEGAGGAAKVVSVTAGGPSNLDENFTEAGAEALEAPS